jgi:polar amino acid transport system substrate-binding protein
MNKNSVMKWVKVVSRIFIKTMGRDVKTMQIILILLIMLITLLPDADSQTTLVLNTANAPPNATKDHTGIGDRVLQEAFRRIGLNVKIIMLPSERALINANEGIEDGNFARVEGIDKIYPNLIRVPEEITKFEFVAFSKKFKFQTTNWDSLKDYNVALITGWKILEANIVNTKSLVKVKNEDILFNLLNADRVDIIVYDRRQGQAVIKRLGLKNINNLNPPLAVKSMYLYLHKKHKDLVPLVTGAIRSMKRDGTYQKIVKEALRS